MFFQNHYNQTVDTMIAVLMGAMMSLASMVVDHLPWNIPTFVSGWGLITLIVLLASMAIPSGMLGKRLASLFSLQQGTLAFTLVANIIPSLVNNTFCTLGGAAVSSFGNAALSTAEQTERWVSMCLADWPIMFVVSFVASLLAQQAGIWVAERHKASPETGKTGR